MKENSRNDRTNLDFVDNSPSLGMALPRIYTAVYSSIPVFEMVVNGIAVMRRRNDSYMNATQILKVAGIDKGKRTKILEREIDPNEGEKVQGGYGKFQGTWTSLQTSIDLARRYQVYDLIQPMLEFDPTTAGNIEEKGHLPITKDQPSQLNPRKRDLSVFSVPSSSSSQQPGVYDDSAAATVQKKARIGTSIGPTSSNYSLEAKHRTILMSIFLSDDTANVSHLLKASEAIDLNLNLDEQGNTALHWAASLARVNTVEQLTMHGATIDRQNNLGETPLMRCVAATNSFDCDCFRKMLKYLDGSLFVSDHQHRTVLHHIALTVATEGRTNAALYYMHHLLYALEKAASPASSQVKIRLLNKQDDHGDTAVSIAARLDCPRLTQLLLDAGADQTSTNNLGLTPNDYADATQPQDSLRENPDSDQQPSAKRSSKPTQRSKEIMATMQKIVDTLDEDYGDGISTRETQLQQTKDQLQATAQTLHHARKELEKRQADSQAFAEGQQKVRNLKQAMETSWNDLQLLLQSDTLDKAAVLALDTSTIDTMTDVPLKARISAYERNNAMLEGSVAGLRAETMEKEMQCKRLIAACCGLALDKVDELVEPLTLAIESDPPDLDLARVIGFMEKIRRQGSFLDPDPL